MFTRGDKVMIMVLGFIMSAFYVLGGLMCNDIPLAVLSFGAMITIASILLTEDNLELLFEDEI